ncbi:E3 SUMO-protein ligase ZBED1-like [Hydra vulgaris]|uniref:E3 SUMO-protein ligase ZBED1-like n=1 Tax=Hydra vulgaris TaxID=6087 RepID=A0ABM4BZM8_HYDVU
MGQLNIYSCLTTDGWTLNSNKSFIAISIHLIDKNWNLVSYIINLVHSQERHTSVNLQKSLEAAMDTWQIPEAFAVVSDNAANTVLALTSSKRVQHMVRCVGHTSQLAINDNINAIQAVRGALAAIRRVAQFFRSSNPSWNVLKQIQKDEIKRNYKNRGTTVSRLPKPIRPIMDCETRWSSKIHMAERMVRLQQNIIAAMQDPQVKKDMARSKCGIPNADHWGVAQTVVEVLKPFADQVTRWSGQRYVSYSAIYPAIFGLLDFLKPDDENDTWAAVQLKEKLQSEIKQRFGLVSSISNDFPCYLGMVAALLDPRLKSLPFLTTEEKASVITYAEELQAILQQQPVMGPAATTSASSKCFSHK